MNKQNDTNKSYVAMVACAICEEPTNELILDRRLRNTFERFVKTGAVCETCKKKYLSKGVLLIDRENGDFAVIKDEAFEGLFSQRIPTGKICFTEAGLVQKLTKEAGQDEIT